MERLTFIERVIASLMPNQYKNLAKIPTTKSIIHFLSILFISYMIMFLLFIPSILFLKSTIKDELAKFKTFNATIKYELSDKASILNDKIAIENSQRTKLEKEKILITDDSVIYKVLPFMQTKKITRDKYSDLTKQTDNYSTFFYVLILLLIPSIFILGYIYFLLKYSLIVLIVTLFLFVTSRTVRFEVEFQKVLNIVIYSSIFLIFIELVTLPFLENIYLINYIVFFIFVVMGLIKTGKFEKKNPTGGN